MDLSTFQNTVAGIAGAAGRTALNAQYPDEFEYYMMTFELLNSQGATKDMLIFPVMPNQLSESTQTLINIKKTSAAMISLLNTTFNPKTINIAGTFGRKIRVLLSDVPMSNNILSTGIFKKGGQLSVNIKSGYGTIKILERIFEKSLTSDEFGKPHFLFLYNPALGNNYLVEVTDYSFQQSLENNMIWNYQFSLRTMAPAESVGLRTKQQEKSSLVKRMAFDNLNRNVIKRVSKLVNIRKIQGDSIQSFINLKKR